MHWYYVERGQQKGPVTASGLQELARLGTIQDQTMVWCQSMTEWQPYAVSFKPAPTSTSMAETGALPQGHRCGECGQSFSESDMVRLGQFWVCAACKPRFIQRLQEGAAPAAAAAWRSGKDLMVTVEASLPN